MPLPVVMGGAALLGAGAQIISGNKAAKATKDASQAQLELERYIYDTTRSDFAPWRAAGNSALGKLGEYFLGDEGFKPIDLSGYKTSPGYEFRLGEGLKALERRASAAGYRLSPQLGKEMVRYAEDYATGDFENYANRQERQYDTYMNRLASLAGIGQTATAQTAQAGSNYAAGAGQANYMAGQARATNAANTGSAINQGIGNLASLYLYNQGYGGGA